MPLNLTGFKTTRHELARPLLVITGSRGTLACGYLDIATFTRLGEAAAIVTGVDGFDAMGEAEVRAISPAAEAIGVKPGMTGAEALEIFR